MWSDVRYAVRGALREPRFFVFAVAILGLGIGANTAMFSIVNPILLRPLPFEEPERLVWISNTSEGVGLSGVTSRVANLRDWRELSTSFDGLTGYNAFFEYGGYTLIGAGEPVRLAGVEVARDFLDVLGVRLALGRSFEEGESVLDGRRAVILTHTTWVRRFDADPAVVGKTLTLNGEPTPVVGVLPASFDFATTFSPGSPVDILLPFPINDRTDRWGNTLTILGRRRAGVSVASAQAELDLINRQLKQADPERWGLGASVMGLQEKIANPYRQSLWLLAGAVAAVLLLACSNLSNLLLARATSRTGEIAVRVALGAGRMRLIRQMLTESLLLSCCGAVIGVAIAWAVTRIVATTTAVRVPMLHDVSMDGTALGFTALVTVLCGFVVGIAPALRLSRGGESRALAESARGSVARNRLRELLVVTEVAVAVVLLVAAGLLARSFLSVLDVELGFQPEGAVAWEIETSGKFNDGDERLRFYQRLVERVASVPGVDSVGLSDTLPLGRNRSWSMRAKGEVYAEGELPTAFPRIVDAGYLPTMRIPLVAGRYFTQDDTAESRKVVIVNEAMARAVWSGAEPLGRIALIAGDEWEVVGIVGDVRHGSLEEVGGLEMYLPITQAGSPDLQLVVRGSLGPEGLIASVSAAMRDFDPTLPAGELETLDQIVDRAASPRRFVLVQLGAFSGAAVVLAFLGIYGVLSYSVSQRTKEIGIRIALGASMGAIRSHVVARTLALTAGGMVAGWLGSLALTRVMASMLYGVEPSDPVTFVGTTALLVGVASLAAYLPARRASRVEPMSALRIA